MKNVSSAEQRVKEHRRGVVGATTAIIKCRKRSSGVHGLVQVQCTCDSLYMFQCSDCGVCTHCSAEYYMVEDEVWYSAVTARSKPSILCIGCLERRIDRLLTKDDFSDAPLNSMPFWPRSKRLMARLELS